MAGDMWAWNLDWFADYVDPCADCAYLLSATNRVDRGGDFANPVAHLPPPYRGDGPPAQHNGVVGIRCARTPP